MSRGILVIMLLICSACGKDTNTTTINKWPGGVVYYNLNAVAEDTETMIYSIMNEIEMETPVRFEYSEPGVGVLSISEWENNYSEATLGYCEYPRIQLQLNARKWIIWHEIFHVLGMLHEHQRKDRDDHIIVNMDNVPEWIQEDFKIKPIHLYDINEYPYDTESIMHYSSNTHGKNVLTLENGSVIKQVYKPSIGDWCKLNAMYK